MIAKSKTAILVSRIVICLIMLAGAIISLGAIEPAPNWYVYYTNLSNYFCLIVVLTETVFTVINLKRGQDKKQLAYRNFGYLFDNQYFADKYFFVYLLVRCGKRAYAFCKPYSVLGRLDTFCRTQKYKVVFPFV